MEQEDRKKKLAAGKEKLAAFRKKRAKKKKVEDDDSQTQNTESAENSANCLEVSNVTSVLSFEVSSLANASALSDLHSFTGESDQYSLTSGDEWSAELALDRMVLQMQMADSPHKFQITDGVQLEGEMQNSFKGTMPELQDALMQRDKIIHQLTTHLQATAEVKTNGVNDPVDHAQETQRLSQQVVLLQQQLTQAGETVEQQVAMCQMSVQALQDAKAQILTLQGKVTEKNNLLQQLSHTLASKTSEMSALQHREAELQHLVQRLQQRALDTGNDPLKAAQAAAGRVVTLEHELERLTSEHAQSQKSVLELQQQLKISETAHQALLSERELALLKITGLEGELDQLVFVKDSALKKMSELEQQVQEGSILLQAESDRQAVEASDRIAQLEGHIEELNERHRLEVSQLSERTCQLEHSLAEGSGYSQTDMQDLKNVINSQQEELLRLHDQLKHKEDELSASKEHLESLNKQIEDLQNKYKYQESEATDAVHNFQQQVQELRDENTRYKGQMALVQEQILSFRDCLHISTPPSVHNMVSQESDNPVEGPADVDTDSDVISQMKQLQASYTYLYEQYCQMLEKSQHVQSEMQTASPTSSDVTRNSEEQNDKFDDMEAEIAQLQSEVAKWIATVHKRDVEVDELKSQLQSLAEEKQRLALQVEQQEHATEEQTLQSDTLHRRMETRVSSLFSEVTEYKEALKESELANIELQDKLNNFSKETDSLKLQLAASEDLMKELQNQLNAASVKLAQTEAEFQEQLEGKNCGLSQLQEQLQEKERLVSQLQEQLKEKDIALSQIHGQLQDTDNSQSQLQYLKLQLQEKDSILSEFQDKLKENDSCVSQLKDQLQERDSFVSGLQKQLEEKDSSLLQLQEQLQEEADEKITMARQLHEQITEKKKSLALTEEHLKDKHRLLCQLQEDMEQKEVTGSQLKEQLEFKTQEIQQLKEEHEASTKESQLQISRFSEDIVCLRQQLDDALQQHQAVLAERDQLVSLHQNQIKKAEENLEQKSAEVKSLSEKKDHMELLLTSTEDSKTKQMSAICNELDKKSREFDEVKVEKEKLLMELSSLKADRAAESEKNNVQLEEHIERLKLAEAEKEQLLSTLESMKDNSSQQLKEMQQKLDHNTEQYQALLDEKQELSSHQIAATEKQTHLVNQLQVKEHECEILQTENEQLHEELQSCSSVYMKEKQCLKLQLLQQGQKIDILLSELDNFQDELLSRESESSCQLRKTQQKLRESTKELEAVKTKLSNIENTGDSKDNAIKILQGEVNSMKDQLVSAETACAKMSQERQQTVEALHNRVHDLEQEILNSKEENEVITSRLGAQADMFKVKEEEMVAENNVLNHQLEEVRNDAQETVHLLQKQLDELQEQLKSTTARLETQEEEVTKLREELEISRRSLQTQESELSSLREEGSQYKDNLDSLKNLNAALDQEKEDLLVKIKSLESTVENMQKDSDDRIAVLQGEISQLCEEKHYQLTEFDNERLLLTGHNSSLQEQLDLCTSEIERLQESLKDALADQDRLKADNTKLEHQKNTLHLEFSSQMEHAQSELAAKDTQLQSIQTQLKDSHAQSTQQLESLHEEVAAAQSEITQKESTLIFVKEELASAKQQLERLTEEKELLKNNFDCCMEDMTQRAAEKDTTIQQLQGRLMEALQNVDRDQVQLREMYESQLSELEDRLAAADLKTQHLEKMCESVNIEKEKMKENYNGHIVELELTIQAAESESSHHKEQLSKMSNAHEKEKADLKHSYEIQLSSLEENYQSLEKALAKQDALLLDANSKYDQERTEQEKAYDQQLSEAYEQVRLYEMDINRLKRQLDEMRKDHQKELQETQKALENQVFDLENKYVIATSKMERMRQALWGMEQDSNSEVQSLHNRIQELEALSHSQEKQIADLQEKLIQSSQLSDESIDSLKESYQSDLAHLEELNQQLRGDVNSFQSQIKAMQKTHAQELEVLKHDHSQNMAVVQEKCRQAENYSHVLQLHMDSASQLPKDPEQWILQEEIERLQQELAGAESNTAVLKQKLKETQASYQTKVSELTDEINTLISDKQTELSHIETLRKNLESKKRRLQELQIMCQNLEEKNKQLTAEKSTLHNQFLQSQHAENIDSRFVSSEKDQSASELQHQIKLTERLQHIQTRRMGSDDDDSAQMDKRSVGFATEGGFEPEPDSLEYLDLAVGHKDSGDYFVEESEPSKSPKIRTKSVPSEVYLEAENEHSLTAPQALLNRSSPDKDHDCIFQDSKETGRFEPEENNITCPDGGRFNYASEFRSESMVDGFHPESLPTSPDIQLPTAAPNLSFLPNPVAALPDTHSMIRSVEKVNSCSQTDPVPLDNFKLTSEMLSLNSNQLQTTEECKDEPETVVKKSDGDDSRADIEAEVARKLQGLQEQLEEEWVQKMRFQEVELQHSYDVKFEEYKRQTEHQCQLHIKQVKLDTQASFVDAVRKMRRSLEKKQRHEELKESQALIREKLIASSSKSSLEMQEESSEKLGDIVKQLHEENQELAEVRDVLLQQIAISQTQGRRHTMQHELQAVIAGSSRLSPHSALTSSGDPASEPFERTEGMAVHEEIEVSQNQSVYSSHADGDDRDDGAQSPTDYDSASQSTPTAGSEDADDRSEGSCVRERFLEELEEMSQQSGQDLPLEWELTSAAVSHPSSGGGAGVFERDQSGSGSVWEVFDGRCLRQDCREVRHRYNNLFHWLSRVCRIPSTPTLLKESSYISQGDNVQKCGFKEGEQREDQREGWVASETDEFDSHFISQILDGKETAVEALLNSRSSFSSECEQENRENVHLSETELLSRLLNAETEKINLEQRLNSHQQLFSQERRELQQRGDDLQARCDDLESNNMTLSQQLADLKHRSGVIQHTEVKEEPENIRGDWSEGSQSSTSVQKGEDHFQMEKVQQMHDSHQAAVNSLQKEKELLAKQVSTLQTSFAAQQEENVKHQEKIAELEGQCALLSAEVKSAQMENEALQSSILVQKEMETKLKEKNSLLAQKLEAMSDYQEITQKKDELQHACSSFKVELAVVQKDLSDLRHENQNLSKENQAVSAICKELKEKVQHLQDTENKYKILEKEYGTLQERGKCKVQYTQSSVQVCLSDTHSANHSATKLSEHSTIVPQKDLRFLHDQVGSLQEENRSLQDKIGILEESCKSLQSQCEVVQERNKFLRYQTETHDDRCEILQTSLQFVKDNLQTAEAMNNSLLDQVRSLEDSKEKCAELEKDNKLLSDELARLKEADSSLQADCKMLEDKCQALQDELKEATHSGQSLREQLHEQSLTLEHVISEMRDEGSQDSAGSEMGSVRSPDKGNRDISWQSKTQFVNHRKEMEDLRQQVIKFEQVISDKDGLIAELKEQMTVLSLQQAAIGSPPAERESARDLEQEVQDLREEIMEKESIIQDLQEQCQSLKQSQIELKRKMKEDSDLEQEVSILHQALFEKEKVIQELKESSKLLQLSQQERTRSSKRHSPRRKDQTPKTDRQERTLPEKTKTSQLVGCEVDGQRIDVISSRSVESVESIAISSDPDSDICPGQDLDIVKEMGRLRKDIKKTKAVYANESALFQEALDREPVSQLGLRDSGSPSSTVDFSEMSQNDIPDDPEQLKKITVKLLEENKCLTTENLRLQLRIREQEALVVEMEGKLQNIKHPPDDWQSLFERQLLLLQKQRDELQHLVCERDTGMGLLSSKIGKEGIEAATVQRQQEDLTVKIGELEHSHRLLQQRQAELAHCQAEKRHLEQILLLKDETERQLMRQKRLLEEELANIEGKLQEREAILVEEKAHLMKELKEKELHIFHLQSSQFSHAQHHSSKQQPELMGRPQGASTPCLSNKFQSSQAYFLQPLSCQGQEPSVLNKPEEGAQGGSFVAEPGAHRTSGDFPATDLKSISFPDEGPNYQSVSHPAESWLVSRRHSTGTAERVSSVVNPVPSNPDEVYKFHREAVDRLREKLRLQMEEEMAQLSEGQASAITRYWQRHNNQLP